MKTRAAVLWGVGEPWKIETVELDPPAAGEVVVRLAAAGICHSEEHFVSGDGVAGTGEGFFPLLGGHEGAGVVVEVGSNVRHLKVGDHVATSFIPVCGICPSCVEGMSYLCDQGAHMFSLGMISDGTFRRHVGDRPLRAMGQLGTFAEHMVVNEVSLVKVDEHVSMAAASLVSCGVATGWGSAVTRAGTRPGDTVVVVGVGGVGMNAVQGAANAGAKWIVAVDPVEWKREIARDFGATHAVASPEEAIPFVHELTWGRGAQRVILTPSVLHGEFIELGLKLAGKGGVCVCTAVSPVSQRNVPFNLGTFGMWSKELRGTVFGAMNPRTAIPSLLALYREGKLKLDELVTRTYSLDDINEGFQDLRDGKNIRGVITFGA